MYKKDKLFNKKNMKIEDFKFTKSVANAFDDMVSRSVPFYEESQIAAINLAEKLIGKNRIILDLGCSTGTTLINLNKKLSKKAKKNYKFIGIDNSTPMINIANSKIKKIANSKAFSFKVGDLKNFKVRGKIGICFMHYTLQFIRPLDRLEVLKNLNQQMAEGGGFILLEKVLSNESLFNRTFIDIFHEYKTNQGYSDTEIKKKREALENVLIPYRSDENITLLKESGFRKIDIFFKWFNWIGIIALK